jgi:hypothetical protein
MAQSRDPGHVPTRDVLDWGDGSFLGVTVTRPCKDPQDAGTNKNALQVEGITQGSNVTARNNIDNAILSRLRTFPIVRVFQYTL